MGDPRDDALESLHDPSPPMLWFYAILSRYLVPVGHHQATIKVLTKDRKAFFKPSEPMHFDVEAEQKQTAPP